MISIARRLPALAPSRASHRPHGDRIIRTAMLLSAAILSALMGYCSPASAQDLDSLLTPKQSDVMYEGYRLRDGETVEKLRLHYATLGTPHRDAKGEIDNAVLMLHWTGNSGASLLTPEYVKALYADGAPLEARRYYLIFPDNFGHGKSTKPSDGLRAKFPHYGYGDLVDLQHKLITESLGIKKLKAIVGMSMGGMNAWQWAEAYPGQVERIMPVVALPDAIKGRNLLWRRMAISDIRNDPEWQRGDYSKPPLGFREAYMLLRMMIDGVPHLQATITDKKSADSYMASIAKQNESADPNDFLYSLEASYDYDPAPDLSKIDAKVYALNFSDDEFNPVVLPILQTSMKLVKHGQYVIQQGSAQSYGHLTMAHPALWAEHVRDFMNFDAKD